MKLIILVCALTFAFSFSSIAEDKCQKIVNLEFKRYGFNEKYLSKVSLSALQRADENGVRKVEINEDGGRRSKFQVIGEKEIKITFRDTSHSSGVTDAPTIETTIKLDRSGPSCRVESVLDDVVKAPYKINNVLTELNQNECNKIRGQKQIPALLINDCKHFFPAKGTVAETSQVNPFAIISLPAVPVNPSGNDHVQ